MTIEKSIQRLYWRFSNGQFTPNQNDVDALNFIAEWVNREKTQELDNRTLFAKIYTYSLIQELDYYKSIHYAQKKIHEQLKYPLAYQYNNFHKKMNEIELCNFHKGIGLSLKHPMMLTPEQNEKEQMIMMENIKTLESYTIGVWDQSSIKKSLNNQITEAVNHYKNLP